VSRYVAKKPRGPQRNPHRDRVCTMRSVYEESVRKIAEQVAEMEREDPWYAGKVREDEGV
jgi:hypothetical protein